MFPGWSVQHGTAFLRQHLFHYAPNFWLSPAQQLGTGFACELQCRVIKRLYCLPSVRSHWDCRATNNRRAYLNTRTQDRGRHDSRRACRIVFKTLSLEAVPFRVWPDLTIRLITSDLRSMPSESRSAVQTCRQFRPKTGFTNLPRRATIFRIALQRESCRDCLLRLHRRILCELNCGLIV